MGASRPKPPEAGPRRLFRRRRRASPLLDVFAPARTVRPFAGALRQRLALKAAAASARLLRLREDERRCATPSTSPPPRIRGPAGRLHRLWRSLAGQDARLDAERLCEALRLLDAPEANDSPRFSARCKSLAQAPARSAHGFGRRRRRRALIGSLPAVRRRNLRAVDAPICLLALQPRLGKAGALAA